MAQAKVTKAALAQEGPIFFGGMARPWDKRRFKGGDAPAPPDPVATANAQANANIATANAQAQINRTNSQTPFGSTTWSQAPNGTWTQTATLAPNVQNLLDQYYSASKNPVQPLDLTSPNAGLQMSVQHIMSAPTGVADNSGAIARTNGLAAGAGNVLAELEQQAANTYSKPLDYSSLGDLPQADEAARQKIQDALYANSTRTLDPYWQQQQSDMASSLAAQGINLGSDAYDRQYGNFIRGRNDAYDQARNDATTMSTDQMQKLFQMAMARRQEGVNEINTQYTMPMDLMGKGQGVYSGLENTLNQDYATQMAQRQADQAIKSAQINDSLGVFGKIADMDTAQHQAAVSDRTNLLNQLTALASGSQIANPAQVQVGQTPVAQSIYNSYQGQLANYNAQQQANNSIYGALGTLGGSLLGAPGVGSGIIGGIGKLASSFFG